MKFLTSSELRKKTPIWARKFAIQTKAMLKLRAPVLLVLDMQNEFLLATGQLPVWGGPAIIPNVVRLVELFREARLPLIFTRHVCLEPFRHQKQIAIMKSVPDAGSLLREGSVGVAIHNDVMPQAGEMVITKYRYSAFYDTALDTVLKVNEVKEVIVTGVATNICCETTAHDAFFRGYDVFFTLDGTGGTDENAHLASLKNIVLSYGKAVTVNQICHGVEARKTP